MSRRRILVTGFRPFGGESLNPAAELVAALERERTAVPGVELVTASLDVARDSLLPELDARIHAARPHAVIALGQAAGRARISLERRARNRLAYGTAIDNAGLGGVDEPIEAGDPDERVTPWPVDDLAARLVAQGHPAQVSDDAGLFLCNALLYHLLRRWPSLPALFVHLPLLPEQAGHRGFGEPGLGIDVTRPALVALLGLLARLAPGGPGPGGDGPR